MEPRQPESRAPIVAAFDPRSAAREPVDFGIAASAFTGSPLVIVAVHPGSAMVKWFGGDVDDAAGDSARAIEHLRLDLERRGVKADVRGMEARTAAGGLEHAMGDLEPGLVVVGATTRGAASAALIGSTAERVVHASRCPVAVVPQGYERPAEGIRTIGVAFAPTPEGREALHIAGMLARTRGARLRAIAVLDPKTVDDQSQSMLSAQHHEAGAEEGTRARQRLDTEAGLRAAVAEAAPGVADTDVDLLTQDPAEGLVAASRHVDVLVMGSRARGPKRAVLLGSVSRKVTEHASCPVLVIPRGAEGAAEGLLADTGAHAPG